MGLYNGKTTTTMSLLCSDPDSVDGETSGFGTASNLAYSSGSFSKESLLVRKYIFPFRKGLSIRGNLITHESILV